MTAAGRLLAFLGMLAFAGLAQAACVGKFANPITDICWSCALPLKIGNMKILSMDQEDTPNPDKTLCTCSNPPKAGLTSSFWEPVRTLDVTRTPYCMTALGGIQIDPGFQAPEGTVAVTSPALNKQKHSFYQAHWYVNPMMFWLEVLLDNRCLEQGWFDIAYLTEIDPMWDDDELSLILAPESALFANVIAQTACAGDCVGASAGFPFNTLYWCAGCNGPIFPLTGNVAAHVSGVQASSLIAQRMTFKMHREMLIWAASGDQGLCGYYPQPVMDKTNYKYQMLYPSPQTKKIAGKCCQPFGRSTIDFGAGKEIPYKGHDFAYQIFRKRNCCQGAVGF